MLVKRSLLLVGLGLSLALGACAKNGASSSSSYRGEKPSPKKAVSPQDALGYWGPRYKRTPKSKKVGLNYAAALRKTGRNQQALAVMRKMVAYHPKDRQVLAAYGKALAGAGQLDKALKAVRRAQADDQPDWKLYSAEGAIHDQLGRPSEARVAYKRALEVKPDEPSVLSNLGMSHLLTGDLKTSERYLRRALKGRAASTTRQNLALVVGLQGRFKEAETIAAADLSPKQAQANVRFLRKMLKQQNAWGDLKKT